MNLINTNNSLTIAKNLNFYSTENLRNTMITRIY
jgi:hypothetical protein